MTVLVIDKSYIYSHVGELGVPQETVEKHCLSAIIGLFPEAHPSFRQPQASLIWRELEEEEGPDSRPRGLLGSALRRRPTSRQEEEEDGGSVGALRRRSSSRRRTAGDCPDDDDDDFGRYFVWGTLAAIFALFINVLYPLLHKASWT